MLFCCGIFVDWLPMILNETRDNISALVSFDVVDDDDDEAGSCIWWTFRMCGRFGWVLLIVWKKVSFFLGCVGGG